jgi:hypothetical protein
MTKLHTWHFDLVEPWSGKRCKFSSHSIEDFASRAKILSAEFFDRHGLWLGFRTSLEGTVHLDSAWSKDSSWLRFFSKNPQFCFGPTSQDTSRIIQACMPSSGDLEIMERCGCIEGGVKTLRACFDKANSHMHVNIEKTVKLLGSTIDDESMRSYFNSCRVPTLPIEIRCRAEHHKFFAMDFDSNVVDAVRSIARQSLELSTKYRTTVGGSDGIRCAIDSNSNGVCVKLFFCPGGWGTAVLENDVQGEKTIDPASAEQVIAFWLLYGWLYINFL